MGIQKTGAFMPVGLGRGADVGRHGLRQRLGLFFLGAATLGGTFDPSIEKNADGK